MSIAQRVAAPRNKYPWGAITMLGVIACASESAVPLQGDQGVQGLPPAAAASAGVSGSTNATNASSAARAAPGQAAAGLAGSVAVQNPAAAGQGALAPSQSVGPAANGGAAGAVSVSGAAGMLAAGSGATAALPGTTSAGSAQALSDLMAYLAMPRATRPELAKQPFASVGLNKGDAQSAKDLLWKDFVADVKETRKDEVGATEKEARTIRVEGNDKILRYYLAKRGTMPASGWSLFISMHGGGNAAASTNDSQWENQISLVDGYNPKDAIWVAPRAPIDDWNMFFIQQIDALFERLITDMIVFENVDPNKVYINGYSAGGDGVYQLGPRMGERWAGAGMSAGHPNASSPLSLRNVPFAIHVGGDDTSYDRNKKAEEWGKRLEMLAAEDPGGYINQWQVHAGKPHWMDLEDAVSIPFLQSHTRNPVPDKIVWEQAEYPRSTFYWLAADEMNSAKGALVRAQYDKMGVHITEVKDVKRISIRFSDDMKDLDLDAPVTVDLKGQPLLQVQPQRTIAVIDHTLQERGDPGLIWSAELTLDLP